ncbi:MAG: DinB family protein [Acidobacteria bacterium]|nr:DinB family protein [Acidobacteriota bacterium]
MAIADALIGELTQEAATTRRVLERVPADKLTWKPHDKSMSLGQLALHVATTPGNVAGMAGPNPSPAPASFDQPEATSVDELLTAFDASVSKAKEIVGGFHDAAMMESWSIAAGDKTLMSMPRIGWLRAIMLNHWYHHRGQLSVYLRLLEVPVPSIYGPSADENPFA